jgi:DNA-directed RNA polymerase specialized sigma24 family protein
VCSPTRSVTKSPRDVPLAALLDLVSAGAEESLRQLYDRTAPGVFSIASAVVRDVDRAELITQQVYLDVWRCAGEFDASTGSVESWLSRLTRERLIDDVTRRRAEQRTLPQVGTERTVAVADWQQRRHSERVGAAKASAA